VTRVLKAGNVHGVNSESSSRAAAATALEEERQAAISAAYTAGYDDGRAAANREGAQAGPRAAQALEALVRMGSASRAAEVDATSRAVLASAVDIAEWVLRHELSTDSRSLLARLSQAALALMPSSATKVTVSSHDEESVRGWAMNHDVEVVVDLSLSAGDARFGNGTGAADVTVAAALRIAAEALGVDPARGVR
jgi:flagellar biosynthesis/type III secretory pathway protein FliH